MDALTQQLLMLMLMHSILSYSTTTATSMALVALIFWSSHHGGNPHGRTVHPGPQRYGSYSLRTIPSQGRIHACHHRQCCPLQLHNSCKHSPQDDNEFLLSFLCWRVVSFGWEMSNDGIYYWHLAWISIKWLVVDHSKIFPS